MRQPETDLSVRDLVSLMRTRAHLHPDRIALDFLGDGENVTASLSYGELDRRARAVAATLHRTGIATDRVLLLLPSGPDYVVAFFACLYAGQIGVPLFPPENGRPQELGRLLSVVKDAEPGGVLTDAAGIEALMRHGVALPGIALHDLAAIDTSADDWQERAVRPDDIAFLQYTSGSTASPKGVIVQHRHLVANKTVMTTAYQETSGDRYLSWLPLYHDMGLILGLLQPLFYGLPLALMSPKRFLERPRRWLEAISRYRATISGGPDFAFRLCADRIRPESVADLDLSCWRVAFSGAEPVRRDTLERFAAFAAPMGFDARALNPCYGLAEATLFVTGHRFSDVQPAPLFDTAALARGRAIVSASGTSVVGCGRSAPDTTIRIVSTEGHPLAEGHVGEIQVRGPTIAAGYWNRSEATDETFLSVSDDETWLRTGDLGFFHEQELYLSSRVKDLIILRGQNIYPQDIEMAVEAAVPGVRPGRVAAFSTSRNGQEAIGIAAEVARPKGGAKDYDSVVSAIREAVAALHDEPLAAVALLRGGALPRTSSGKLQRAACRAAWEARSFETLAEYRPVDARPDDGMLRTATEHRLAAIWRELLDVRRISAGDSFFLLGGQSLLMTQMAGRVQRAFGVAMPLAFFFTASTLAELAQHIDHAPRASAPLPLERRGDEWGRSESLPLSFAQQRLWFQHMLEPDSPFYNMAIGMEFSGPVDPRRMQAALDRLGERHEALRTAYSDAGEQPRQSILPSRAMVLDKVGDGAEDFAGQAMAFVEQPFDLRRGELIRAGLFGPASRPRLLLAIHHIAVDGSSLPILLADLAAAYAGHAEDAGGLQYADFALWQRAALEPRMPALAEAWRWLMEGAPRLSTLPTDFPRPAVQSHRGASLHLDLDPALMLDVQHWALAHDATPFMALFAAYAATIAAIADQDDFVIGTDIANRLEPGTQDIVGFFVNQLPVRCRIRPSEPPDVILRRVRQALLDVYAVQDLPFEKTVEILRPARDTAHAPLFQTKFVFQDAPPALSFGPGLDMTPFVIDRGTAELDLLFDLARHADGRVAVCVEYATDLYRPETIRQFIAMFVARLREGSGARAAPMERRGISRRVARAVQQESLA